MSAATQAVPVWTVEVIVDEEDGQITSATARVCGSGREAVGHGAAHRNPTDHPDPTIGDELAVARALADAAEQLLNRTRADIEVGTEQPVTRLHL